MTSPTNSNQFEFLGQLPATCFSKCFVWTVPWISSCDHFVCVSPLWDKLQGLVPSCVPTFSAALWLWLRQHWVCCWWKPALSPLIIKTWSCRIDELISVHYAGAYTLELKVHYRLFFCYIAWKYSDDFPSTSTTRHKAHSRSATAPMSLSQSYRPSSPSRSLSYALDDLNISTNSWKNFSDPVLRYKSRYSPNLRAALGASDRIQQRVEKVIEGKSPRKFVSVKFKWLYLPLFFKFKIFVLLTSIRCDLRIYWYKVARDLCKTLISHTPSWVAIKVYKWGPVNLRWGN